MSGTVEFWFRRKYNLAPRDPRFLDLTPEDIESDYWAHYYYENAGKSEVEDDDFDLDAEIARMNDNDWEDVTGDWSAD